ncbi:MULTISPECIES: hypothetical protein [unclassified Kitasatospora]|uniref:hypothetical protein n=1 Tax=unclassified Kitasatospora TaxID=2633591 RepID=UPI00070EA77D|nr:MULTISPECIES: hypothetical protein [unclassified Kitasatospora]KQV23950.1 hypothetical protein ASC99_01705 [Kitasatospora sp. Root107]KRB67337.1 hypothetical protein ASE03_03030 [Kitasatospora sp. Root187]
MRRTVRGAVAATACTVVLATGLAACGTVKQLTAAEKVSDAFGNITDSKTFKAELSFGATADEILAFDKLASDKGEQMDRKTAELMAELKISLAVSADKPLKDLDSFKNAQSGADPLNSLGQDPGYDVAYALSGKSGKSYAELRLVDGNIYVKADVDGIAQLAGEDAGELKDAGAMFPKVIQDALAGKWISIEGKTLKEFAEQATKAAGSKSGGASAAPSVDPKVASGLVNTVKDVLSRNVTFEDKGKQDGAEHIYVAAPAKALADDLLKSIKPVLKDIPGMEKLPGAAPTDIPDKKIGLDVFIKDGSVSAISFDLAQIDPKLPAEAHLPVKVTFSKDAGEAPKAPDGATKFAMSDFEEIVTSMMGSAGSKAKAGGKTAAAPLTAAQIKELTATGITEAQVKLMNQSGMTFEQIKKLLGATS